ncbi:MAG: aldehyde oxidase [Candidatus Rokubacteria bacterium 13_1_20CM_2_68_19]|nr:MAG: aldehyde oxidase [Candidatus Rokubacteria bacterium 13_2_20CM_69_10]OLB39132.1 MAG: aldehyde oxidase [Candidatus Rokubacteria bacterium 13_2_20CM_2_64_8]OLC57859.1 MAG: aldehyde oxidase [Candidatus Rokubacteria bacterium 13_1_40CM_4_67_11]OLD31817.1 MAG: aldehyde oxidase [Candidatus Rokubacteria bacterium 13_1_40CM_2_68_13]OLE44014.1 MAG: aldehyde oxidase [Candidatus Rokubacteria bacterium 13_1_20CM_2_68_19]
MNKHEFTVIGRPLPKIDAWAKVVGETRYADDLVMARMAHGKLLRSIHPHALIKLIDTSRARALPGVYAVITGADLPRVKFGILPVSQDEEALCNERVRMVGDAVAAVAAQDEETAEAACRLIEVEYEPLPALMSIEESLGHPEVRIHEYGDGPNVHKNVALQFGDVEAAFARADLVREDVFFYEGNTHLPMEQHAAVAQWGADGKLTLWSSTQTPHYVHRLLAKILDVPPAHIRVIATPVGGGFGGKLDPFAHEIAACKLSQLTGRPVKITLTREEVFYVHRGRHPVLMWLKTGFTRDGEITGSHIKTWLDGGAYGSYGVASTFYTGVINPVTYKMPVYKFEGARVFTNKPPCGPKRGHGTPQPRFALEVQIDKAAEQLGLDPAEMRRRIVCEPFTKTANHLTVTTIGLGECIDKVVEASGWRDKWRGWQPPARRRGPKRRGVGVACSAYMTGAGTAIYWNSMPHSGVVLRADRSGGVSVLCGATDIGQGSDSILAYLPAEVLGLDPKDVHVHPADTTLTPVDLGSYSSRVTLMCGMAAIQAAERLRAVMSRAVARKFEVAAERLVFRDRKVGVPDDWEKAVPFSQAVELAEAMHGVLAFPGSYAPPKRAGKYKGGGVGPSPCYSYSACVVELTVDEETGEVELHDVWIGHDIGRALNPLLVEGQVEGSVYMGIGEALMEAQVFRKGLHKHPSLLEYKSPTTLETPEIHTILIETDDPEGPFGAKEAGQGPLLPVLPAIANAVYNAVGVRVDEVPIVPEKILKGLELKRQGKTPRVGPERIPLFKFKEPLVVESAFGQPADAVAVRPFADQDTSR